MAGEYCCYRLVDVALVSLLFFSCTFTQGTAQGEGAVRLFGGNHAFQGYLQLYSGDSWGTVCSDDEWDETDAIVVCRQIGAIGGVMSPKSGHTFTKVDGSIPIYMAKVGCDGTEERLGSCSSSNDTSSCTHASDVKMDCVIPGFKACVVNNGDLPLTGRIHNQTGMSVSKCAELCRKDGYHYAGVDPLSCYCGSAGDDFRKYGVAPNTECMSLCGGGALQACGAERRIAVHEVVVGSCSGSLKAGAGAIASPEFPGAYPLDGRTCQWVVDVSENGDTAVRFPVFNLAGGDEIHISIDGGKNWTVFNGTYYSQENPPFVATFDENELRVKFVIAGSSQRDEHVSFVLTFQENTSCDVVEFPNGYLDVVDGAAYRPGDKVEVLCEKQYMTEWKYSICREDGLWHRAPECIKAPPVGPSLVFTQTYLFMMLAVMGALGLIFFMVICGVICVGRKKKKEGYTGISRQESAEPTKAENEYHIDMHEGSDMDMQHVGGQEEQAIPLASGAMDD
ncbi:deleted in malignant brain tumors 1 protein-like isoform X2 [Acanthaster planci]|uniref:Deleted in malignant brain tumors 1 protein-like isoform X2 n=1 Tax=Acanthaster planci TaxID=133434 RepID=A0A8B7Z9C4_ACAPL|nr:deleted in malignant brain tumors 1 protein-like isoform X2 [Acanthaster planci]